MCCTPINCRSYVLSYDILGVSNKKFAPYLIALTGVWRKVAYAPFDAPLSLPRGRQSDHHLAPFPLGTRGGVLTAVAEEAVMNVNVSCSALAFASGRSVDFQPDHVMPAADRKPPAPFGLVLVVMARCRDLLSNAPAVLWKYK